LYLLKEIDVTFRRNYIISPLFANIGTLPILDLIIIIAQNNLLIQGDVILYFKLDLTIAHYGLFYDD